MQTDYRSGSRAPSLLARRLCALLAAAGMPAALHAQSWGPGLRSSPTSGPTVWMPTDAHCGSQSLSQSTNPTTITDSVWCGNSTSSAATSLARGFTAPSSLALRCVTFGVRDNIGGPFTVKVRVKLGSPAQPYASLVQVAEVDVPIPAGTSNTLFTVDLPNEAGLIIPAGQSFIVELHSPTRIVSEGGDGGLLSFGCNNLGQTAPTYIHATSCGVTNFLDLAAVGFPNTHLAMELGVESGVSSLLTGGVIMASSGPHEVFDLGDELLALGNPALGPVGVELDLGEGSQGASAHFRVVSNDEIGANVAVTFSDGTFADRLSFSDRPGNPDDAVLTLDFDDPSFDLFDIAIFNDGVYVGTLANQTSGSVAFTDPGLDIWKWLKNLLGIKAEVHCEVEKEYYPDGTLKSEKKSYGGSLGTSKVIPTGGGGGGGGLIGNEFIITPALAVPPVGGGPATITIEATGGPGVAVSTEDLTCPGIVIGSTPTKHRPKGANTVVSSGVQFRAIGTRGSGIPAPDHRIQAVFRPSTGTWFLKAQEDPSSHMLEVTAMLGGVDSFEFATNFPNNPDNICARVCAWTPGPGGIEIPSGKTQFDPWPGVPGFTALLPDFSGVGSGTYTIQLYAEGALLYTQTGQTGIAGGTNLPPSGIGKVGLATPCYRIRWPKDTIFQTIFGQILLVDEARILAEGTTGSEQIARVQLDTMDAQIVEISDVATDIALPCYADCDSSGALNIFDYICFGQAYSTGQLTADCDGNGSLNIFDYICFGQLFAAGCP